MAASKKKVGAKSVTTKEKQAGADNPAAAAQTAEEANGEANAAADAGAEGGGGSQDNGGNSETTAGVPPADAPSPEPDSAGGSDGAAPEVANQQLKESDHQARYRSSLATQCSMHALAGICSLSGSVAYSLDAPEKKAARAIEIGKAMADAIIADKELSL